MEKIEEYFSGRVDKAEPGEPRLVLFACIHLKKCPLPRLQLFLLLPLMALACAIIISAKTADIMAVMAMTAIATISLWKLRILVLATLTTTTTTMTKKKKSPTTLSIAMTMMTHGMTVMIGTRMTKILLCTTLYPFSLFKLFGTPLNKLKSKNPPLLPLVLSCFPSIMCAGLVRILPFIANANLFLKYMMGKTMFSKSPLGLTLIYKK